MILCIIPSSHISHFSLSQIFLSVCRVRKPVMCSAFLTHYGTHCLLNKCTMFISSSFGSDRILKGLQNYLTGFESIFQ
jgi:hypothetical protein